MPKSFVTDGIVVVEKFFKKVKNALGGPEILQQTAHWLRAACGSTTTQSTSKRTTVNDELDPFDADSPYDQSQLPAPGDGTPARTSENAFAAEPSSKELLAQRWGATTGLEVRCADIEVVAGRARNMSETNFNQLRANILANGVVDPVMVRESMPPGCYELVAGHHRFRIAQELGWKTIPAVLSQASVEDAGALAFYSNLWSGEELSEVEKYDGFRRRIRETGFTQEQVASEAVRSPQYVSKILTAFNRLPVQLLERIRQAPQGIGALAAHALADVWSVDQFRAASELEMHIKRAGSESALVKALRTSPENEGKVAKVVHKFKHGRTELGSLERRSGVLVWRFREGPNLKSDDAFQQIRDFISHRFYRSTE
jgi:ParB/RepB/Spo0J family partition protein